MQPTGSGGGFGLNVTPLARRILITLVVAYFCQLILSHSFPVNQWLAMWPIRSGYWRPWQPFTFLLLNGPLPWPLIEWFFLASFQLFLVSWLMQVEPRIHIHNIFKGMIRTILYIMNTT